MAAQSEAGWIENGSFENGLTGWQTFLYGGGQVEIVPGGTDGEFCAEVSAEYPSIGKHEGEDVFLSQQFFADAGDQLSFDSKVWWAGDGGTIFGVSLSNVDTGAEVPLENWPGDFDIWSTREATLPETGQYSLTFLVAVDIDPGESWAQAKLHLDNVRLVPEPSTLALLGMAVAGLLGHSWRKRRR